MPYSPLEQKELVMWEVFEVETGEVWCRTELEHQAFVTAKRMGPRYDFDRRTLEVWPESTSIVDDGV